mmetsp:Transcript_9800/g.16369  ORF Transcript_9800/g.16369 Transcript_9800/m.16369 type:complete len:209 (-) Transcript_9800:67-693(-)
MEEEKGTSSSLSSSFDLLDTLQRDGEKKSFRYEMSNTEFELRRSKMDFLNLMRDPRSGHDLLRSSAASAAASAKHYDEDEEYDDDRDRKLREDDDFHQSLREERNGSFYHRGGMTPEELELRRSRINALHLMRDVRDVDLANLREPDDDSRDNFQLPFRHHRGGGGLGITTTNRNTELKRSKPEKEMRSKDFGNIERREKQKHEERES